MNSNPLPSGMWLRLSNLPTNTTEEELDEFFRAHGLDCGDDCFSVKTFGGGQTGAIFSVPDEMLPALLKWAIAGDGFKGRQIELANWKQIGRSQFRR